MLVPILPFLFFNDLIESMIRDASYEGKSELTISALIAGVLATDIFLPVPSSFVSTLGGKMLGTFRGTMVSWMGMNVGALLGFALARRWGYPFAKWFSKEEELTRVKKLCDRYGPMTLILARGVPVFAEASVLLMGIHRLSWARFVWPIFLSNLGVSFAYSGFGDVAAKNGWMPLALGVAIGLPVALLFVVKRWMEVQERKL